MNRTIHTHIFCNGLTSQIGPDGSCRQCYRLTMNTQSGAARRFLASLEAKINRERQ